MSERQFQEDARTPDARHLLIKPGIPDWRNADSYRHLLELDAEGWAWEWLRRNPAYVEAAESTPLPVAEPASGQPYVVLSSARIVADWGLHFRGASVDPSAAGKADLARQLLTFGACGRRDPRANANARRL